MLPKFELHIPTSVNEASKLKKEFGIDAVMVAGGSDVYAKMHQNGYSPGHIIDLKQITELQGMRFDPAAGLDLGACVTHHEIETSEDVKKYYPILEQAVRTIGSYQVRNRGTIGGNICTAAPSADAVGSLIVLKAECLISGLEGSRTVLLEDFFTGPKQTVLKEDEILVRVTMPAVENRYGGSYYKYGRRNAMEIALLGVSVYLETEDDGTTCKVIRIALGTSAPTPMRARATEDFLRGKNLTDKDVLDEAGKVVLNEARPRSSWRSSAQFRKDLLERLVPRTVLEAYKKIR